MTPFILRHGMAIRVRLLDGAWQAGAVTMASENGKSVIVTFDEGMASFGTFMTNGLALSIDYEEEIVEDLLGNCYEVEFKP